MSTVRIKKKKIRDFTQIDNCIIRDKTISHCALGYFTRLWYLPDNFKIKRSGLETLFGIKKNQYYKLNRELQNRGYLNIKQIKDEKGRWGVNEWELDDMGNLTVCQNSVSRKTVCRNSDTNNTIGNNIIKTTTTIVEKISNEKAYQIFVNFGFNKKDFSYEYKKFKLLNEDDKRTVKNWKRWCYQIKEFNKKWEK